MNISSDPAQLAQRVADYILTISSHAIRQHGQCSLALSGGSTPRDTYQLLATPAYADRMDWSRIFVFWGDERCVPPDDPESNFYMAYEALLKHVPIPPQHIHRMRGEEDPETGAAKYEADLRAFSAQDRSCTGNGPCFDLNLLGLGENGHTASLFPGAPALAETQRWVVAQCVDATPPWRLTLTPHAINAARHIAFIVSGSHKASILAQVLKGPSQPEKLPAQLVQPTDGEVIWFIDQAAGRLLA